MARQVEADNFVIRKVFNERSERSGSTSKSMKADNSRHAISTSTCGCSSKDEGGAQFHAEKPSQLQNRLRFEVLQQTKLLCI